MKNGSYAIPAVVVGGGLNGLGVVRSLGQAGVPVTVLDKDPGAPAMRSRFARAIRAGSHGSEKVEGRDLIDTLMDLRSGWDTRPVLFLTQEESVAFVSARRERLGNGYRMTMPAHDTMATLLDKTRFQARAEALGFPLPRSCSLSGLQHLPSARRLRYPCIVKPVTKNPLWGAKFKKAYEVATFAELETLYRTMVEFSSDVIVQEWIKGQDCDVYFCLQYRDRSGHTRASFTGRKIRQWPPMVGGTASCMPAPGVATVLEELTSRFFDAVGFVGICSMEYKRDQRDGQFYMVEPTVGRTDYQEEVATLNGDNIVLAAYEAECDLPARPRAPTGRAPGRIWRDPFGDARSAELQPDHVAPAEAKKCEVVDAYWRWNDPGPWIGLRFDAIRNRLRRLAK
ncbi:MAG: FAD-dependent oxidoreductase [Alphaproteobacteria bacterium]|nr:FAD-dependent oxidoreductase [Alphaproteobacteria bacterium]